VLVNLPNADLVLLIFRGFIFYETELKFNHFVAGFFPAPFPPGFTSSTGGYWNLPTSWL